MDPEFCRNYPCKISFRSGHSNCPECLCSVWKQFDQQKCHVVKWLLSNERSCMQGAETLYVQNICLRDSCCAKSHLSTVLRSQNWCLLSGCGGKQIQSGRGNMLSRSGERSKKKKKKESLNVESDCCSYLNSNVGDIFTPLFATQTHQNKYSERMQEVNYCTTSLFPV